MFKNMRHYYNIERIRAIHLEDILNLSDLAFTVLASLPYTPWIHIHALDIGKTSVSEISHEEADSAS